MIRNGRMHGKPLSVYSSPPSLSSSSLNSASCSSRPLSSHSEASLAPSSTTGGPAVFPTSVVARKSGSAWLHRSSANSSAILVRSCPGWARELSSLFQDGRPEGLLAFPLRAVLSWRPGVEWSMQGTVLSGRLELVELGGKALVGTRHCRIRLLLFTGAALAVLGLIEPLLGPALVSAHKPAIDIGQGSRRGNFLF